MAEPQPTTQPDNNTCAEEDLNPCAGLRLPWVWQLAHMIAFVPFRLFVRTRAVGIEHIDQDRGGLLLMNHQSFLDPIFVGARLSRPVSYLARESLWKVPFVGWACRNLSAIPISRTAFRGGSVRQAIRRLQEGFLVGIYPEGTRSSGEPGEFRPGFLALVRRSEIPIYPVAIVGADRAMPRGAIFIRPVGVTVVFGKPLSAEEVSELKTGSDDKALAMQMQQHVLELYRSERQKN